MTNYDVVIIGAGASGLFCAAQVASFGMSVLVVDAGKRPGRKIIMSGGGRCNFTNITLQPNHYISKNAHFCKSALARFSPWDFLSYIHLYQIPYHEREHGQLFCDHSASDIVDLLMSECKKNQVDFLYKTEISSVIKEEALFKVFSGGSYFQCSTLVIATGGLSMPKLDALPFGYQIAQYFGINVIPTRAGLVPLTLHTKDLFYLQTLSGIALPVEMYCDNSPCFRENLLFTHRGISGPVVLQISNYWQAGQAVHINLLVDQDIWQFLDSERQAHPKSTVKNTLSKILPKRLVEALTGMALILNAEAMLSHWSKVDQEKTIENLSDWQLTPNGTEGYRTAEVTLGGVDTSELSSKTMESKKVDNLYFIGEVVDVTGWLGGYNFQWAWSSAWACAQAIVVK